jgi:ABC-type transport system involved in multi-copper enzyme maturation permease subunit
MRQFWTIAVNAFLELVRQPVFLLLMTASTLFCIFLSLVPYIALGDDPKLVKDAALALMFVVGLFGAVINASASVAHEIRTGTALAVLAKPVGRARFLLAKYVGLAAALTVLTYVNLLSALLAARMAFDAYGDADTSNASIYVGGVALAYALAGFINYFLRRPFVANAVFFVVCLTTIAAVYIILFTQTSTGVQLGGFRSVDWRMIPAAILILFALLVLAGVALACSTRLETIPTLAICTAVFLVGLMSDYFFGRRAEPAWASYSTKEDFGDNRWSEDQVRQLRAVVDKYDLNRTGRLERAERAAVSTADQQQLAAAGLGGSWWASVLYCVSPNWQLFWLADTLEKDTAGIPWTYVGKAFAYVVGYLGASLALALILFEERELS